MTQPINVDEDTGTVTITDCTITFNNAFDPTTGVASITITPVGGLGTLPGVLQGQPGYPPTLRNVNLTQVAYGEAIGASTWTEIQPGGAGEPSIYDLNIELNSGAPGEIASFLITAAEDVVGAVEDFTTLLWNSAVNAFQLVVPPVGVYTWPTVINSTSGTSSGPRTLAQITVPAQPWPWYPIVSGHSVVVGSVNTQVSLTANIGASGGVQVGSGSGVAGVVAQDIGLYSSPPAGTTASAPLIGTNTQATIVLSATQTGPNVDAWSTSAETTTFSVMALPVLGT
jgi:hypothetical protein